jgi:hypothetical protein
MKRKLRPLGQRKIDSIPCFEYDEESDWEKALDFFREYQILHMRSRIGYDFKHKNFRQMFQRFSCEVEKNFSCENTVFRRRNLSAATVFAPESALPVGSWYASSILQPREEGRKHEEEMEQFLEKFLPVALPGPLQKVGDVSHSLPVWFFVGQHKVRESDRTGKKQQPLSGRKEHTDSVTCTGTWHLQISGTKIWLLRPFAEHSDWGGQVPLLELQPQKKCRRSKSPVIPILHVNPTPNLMPRFPPDYAQ